MIGIVMKGERFARQTLSKMRAVELWVTARPEDGKMQARTVFEIVVDRGVLLFLSIPSPRAPQQIRPATLTGIVSALRRDDKSCSDGSWGVSDVLGR